MLLKHDLWIMNLNKITYADIFSCNLSKYFANFISHIPSCIKVSQRHRYNMKVGGSKIMKTARVYRGFGGEAPSEVQKQSPWSGDEGARSPRSWATFTKLNSNFSLRCNQNVTFKVLMLYLSLSRVRILLVLLVLLELNLSLSFISN